MPGRGANQSISDAKSDIHSVCGAGESGVGGSDTSSVGGEGRKGASGHGMLDDPSYTRIDAQVLSKPMNGMATGGKTGYASGDGRTFSGSASKRSED